MPIKRTAVSPTAQDTKKRGSSHTDSKTAMVLIKCDEIERWVSHYGILADQRLELGAEEVLLGVDVAGTNMLSGGKRRSWIISRLNGY